MADSSTSTTPNMSISPAKTHITNQKNITNFFRVTTPTPSSKRENSDLKVTPKKVPHLPCGKQIVRDEKVPPVTAPAEIFIVEDSRPDSIPEKREAETCDISAHDIQSVIEIPSDEIPTSVVETILTADPIITTFSPQESPIVVEISEPTTQIEAQKKRSRKKTQKYSDDQPTAEYTTSLESHPPMSSALTERLQNSRQKAHSLLQSLVSDHSSLREALKGSRETEFLSISEELNDILGGTDDSEEIFTAFMDSFKTKVKRFIQLYVQDHVAPLTDIYSALKVDFDILRGKVFQSDYCHKEKIITELNSYDTVEYLKEVARRVSYGYRSPTEIKETSHFDDESSIALWRWELVVLPENFPHGEEIKAVKSDFTRVGKAIRAIYKVISEIIKCARLTGTISSQDEVKINSLEDKVTAALGEVQKANEKKASLLKKKIAQETEAEKRLKRKEELAATKATKTLDDEHSKKRSSADCSEEIEKGDSTNVVPKKKLKSLGEKALKEMATLEKQKSMLMSFFTSPTSKAKKPANDCSPSGPLLCASVGDSPEDRVDAPSLEPSAPRVNVEKIDQYFKTPLTMAEIYAANKNRYTSSIDLRYHKSFRKPKTLSVTVTSSSEGAWESGANYAEIKDIRVDSRKRLFSFAEDFRPPYYGTFSKKSRIVSGRRPFAKDPTMNYDYDSEAEWEEEDPEGEDIAVSDNEVEDEGDEIVYDDFFCRDNEVEHIDGDICDSDMVSASNAVSNRMTINGVRFIGMDMRARVITLNGDCVEMTSQDIDTEILLNYSAILHPHLFESENPSTCVLPRMCVGVPRRLLALAASVQKGEIPSESSKELKDSRNFKDSMLPDLVQFVHGKKDGVDKLVDGFIETLQATEIAVPAKSQIKKRILEVAEKKKFGESSNEEKNLHGASRWRVHAEVASKLGIELPSVENPQQKAKSTKKISKLPCKTALVTSEDVASAPASATTLLDSGASESAKVSLLQYFQHGKDPEIIVSSSS